MITYEWLYVLAGSFFAIWSALSLKDRKWGTAGFWGLLAASFFFGSYLSDLANGLLVLAMVAIAGLGWLKRSTPPTTTPEERADRSAGQDVDVVGHPRRQRLWVPGSRLRRAPE